MTQSSSHAVVRVLHCVASLDPTHGGPSQTVVALTDALALFPGLELSLVAQRGPGEDVVASRSAAVHREVGSGRSAVTRALGLPTRRGLRRVGRHALPEIVHNHCLWRPENYWAGRAAHQWGARLIVHPRGMLDPWALQRSRLRKRASLWLFQRGDLDFAAALVATSELEYEQLRSFGLRQPIAVIPNGVVFAESMPDAIADPVAELATGLKSSQGSGKDSIGRPRLALFLSRVHPKKGLPELIQAWHRVDPSGASGWRLRIAGPDEGRYWSRISSLIERLGLVDRVEYLGMVEGAEKARLYRQADLFVLPTFSENFGVVVAEALSYGVPVITTRAAPWADLERFGCGWWIETGVEPLVAALGKAMALSDVQRQAMGARGRAFVQRYDWDRVAEQTLSVYLWVLGRGSLPACVRCD